MGIGINVVAPFDATPHDLTRLGAGACQRPDVSRARRNRRAAHGKDARHPFTKTVPIGVGATHDFVAEVAEICGVEPKKDLSRLRQPWWSKSVDSTYLTGKRVFLFGDATHVKTAARIARDEMGFEVVGLGCYNREFARSIRQLGKEFGVEP
jgi:light-independent protochlorophyllide reductase subunit B